LALGAGTAVRLGGFCAWLVIGTGARAGCASVVLYAVRGASALAAQEVQTRADASRKTLCLVNLAPRIKDRAQPEIGRSLPKIEQRQIEIFPRSVSGI